MDHKSSSDVSGTRPLRYPASRQEEILEIIHDKAVADPFRWLEEDSRETLKWQAAQNELAERVLRRWHGYRALRRSLAELLRPLGYSLPKRRGARQFQVVERRGHVGLFVSTTDGEMICEVEPGAREDGDVEDPSFDWFEPSPDGRFVAYGSAEGGGLQGGAQLLRLRIREVGTNSDLPLRMPHVAPTLVWLPDTSGFYCVVGLNFAASCPERRLLRYRLGEAAPSMEPLRGLGFCCPQVSPDGRYLAVVTGLREPRADFLLDRRGTSGWKPFLNEVPAACFGCFGDGSYLAVTTLGAPNGRLVAIPLDGDRSPSCWQELLPETDTVLREVAYLGAYLVVLGLSDTAVKLHLYRSAPQLEDLGEIGSPSGTAVSSSTLDCWFQVPGRPLLTTDEEGFSFFSSSLVAAPTPVRFDLRDRKLVELAGPSVRLPGLVERRERVATDNGPGIGLWIAHRADLDLTVSQPALLYSYGAYNYATMPGYLGALAPFALAGGLVIFANVRGGGECGGEWWRAGHHEHKQRSFDDIYCVASDLISRGLTRADKLALVGLSNGGLNVCVALVQRPDLFGAAAALAPHCDLLRYSRDPFCGGAPIEGHHDGLHVNAGTWRNPNWGLRSKTGEAPRIAEPYFPEAMYPTPLGYSPYHNVKADTAYPACLFVSGDRDLWCPPWHSRKLCARLQSATTASAPILLRVWPGAGHDAPVAGGPDQVAEWLGFLMMQVGLDPAA